MIKLLFLNAVNPKSEHENRYNPLGIMYLSAALKQAFPQGTLSIELISKDFEKHIKVFHPDIVAITSVSQNYNRAKLYAEIAHQFRIPVIIGGMHISTIPCSLTRDMDVGCIGESEVTIVELMKAFINNGKTFSCKQLEQIPGIIFWKDGIQIETLPRPLIQNMDLLPQPDRTLDDYKKHAYMFSSRGCPYRCLFCYSSRFWEKVRLFSPEYIVEEIIDLVRNYKTTLITFYDDLFAVHRERINKIRMLLEGERVLNKIKFTCFLRANLVTEDLISDLKKMRIFAVGLGLESGNQRILQFLKSKNITVEQNKHAVKLLTDAGIKVNATFIIGSPDETKDEMMETYNFIKDNPLSFVDIYTLMPFPGTPVWEYALQKGLVCDDMDWDKLNVNIENRYTYDKSIIVSEIYTKQEIYQFYKKFRRLRFIKNVKALPGHPYLIDLPRIGYRMIRERFLNYIRF